MLLIFEFLLINFVRFCVFYSSLMSFLLFFPFFPFPLSSFLLFCGVSPLRSPSRRCFSFVVVVFVVCCCSPFVVVVSRSMEYSHLYPTVSKDTAVCSRSRPRCLCGCPRPSSRGERRVLPSVSCPAASTSSAKPPSIPSAPFYFLWL